MLPFIPHSNDELRRLHATGRYSDLVEAHRDNLSYLQAQFDSNDRNVGIGILRLGSALYESGRFLEAERVLQDGLVDVASSDALRERNLALFLDLASIYLSTERLDESEQALAQADSLMTRMARVSTNQRAVASLYSARILMKRGNLDDAEQLLTQASDRLKNETGRDNRTYAVLLDYLSQSLDSRGRSIEAERTIRDALEAYPSKNTAYYANSLRRLGMYLARQGKIPDARTCTSEAISILRRVRPAMHPDIIRAEAQISEIEDREH